MYFLFTTLFSLILGRMCSRIAKSRGRDPIAWFYIGTFFGVLGLILLYYLPDKKELSSSPFLEVTEPSNDINPTLAPAISQKFWYYLDGENKQYGPMSFHRLEKAWVEDRIDAKTYVWNEEMSSWKILDTISDAFAQLPKKPSG